MNAPAPATRQIWTRRRGTQSFRIIGVESGYVVMKRCWPTTGEIKDRARRFVIGQTTLEMHYRFSGEWKGDGK